MKELDSNNFSLVRFYERRARRILPALIFVIICCLPFAWLWLSPNDLVDFAKSVFAVSIFSSNILFWTESGYFDTAAELKPLLHTWSLAVEEQYYIVFPLFLMLAWQFGKRALLTALIAIFIVSLSIAQWGALNYPSAAFFLLPTRGWEILLGAFCAFYLDKKSLDGESQTAHIFSVVGLSLIVFAVFTFDETTPMPGLYALVPTVGTALIILFGTDKTIGGKVLSNSMFVGIGLISYSAYLWHQPIFSFARHAVLGEPSNNVMLGLSALSIVLAFISWKIIETPFRNKRKFSQNKILSLAAISTFCIMMIALFGYLNNGFTDRFEVAHGGDVGHLKFHRYADERFLNCEPTQISDSALSWGDFLRCKQSRSGLPEVVLLGDSHAEHLFIGLAESLPERNVTFYILGGAPYVTNNDFEIIFDELLGNGREQLVLLSMHYVLRVGGANEELYRGLKKTIEVLRLAGNRVVLIGDIPRFDTKPVACVYRLSTLSYKKTALLCNLPLQTAEKQKGVYEETLKQLSKELSLTYIDLYPVVCSERECSMIKGPSVIYRDKDHLNIPGSKIVGRYVVEKLNDDLKFFSEH